LQIYARTNIKQAAAALSKEFDPIRYEEAVHTFEISKYVAALPKKKLKTLDEFVYFIKLGHLDDDAWLRSHGLHRKPGRIGIISNPRVVEIYTWLTTNFLLTDFSDHDLNKIAYLGQENFDINVIKSEAPKITDIDKRNVSYLYAVVRDKALRVETIKSRLEEREELIRNRLYEVVRDLPVNKLEYTFSLEDKKRRALLSQLINTVNIDEDQ
jgi:hypothetical protein